MLKPMLWAAMDLRHSTARWGDATRHHGTACTGAGPALEDMESPNID